MQGRISISRSVLPVPGNRPCCCDSVSQPHVGSGSTRSGSTGSGSTEKCCWHQFAFGIRAENLSHDSEQLNRFVVRNAAEQLDHSAAGEEPDLAGCERVAASQKPECVNYAPMVSGCRVVRQNAFVKKCRKSARMSHLEENTMFFFIQRNPTAIHRFVRYRCGIAPNSQCIGQLRLVSSLWIMNQ